MRYQVITYSRNDGADEKLDYGSIAAADRAAQSYTDGFDGSYDGAIVYDKQQGRALREYGYFPEAARPTERGGTPCTSGKRLMCGASM